MKTLRKVGASRFFSTRAAVGGALKNVWRAGWVALLMAAGSAHAVDDLVPPYTKLKELPKGTKVIAVRDLALNDDFDGKTDVYSLDLGRGWFTEFRKYPVTIPKGTRYSVKHVLESNALRLEPLDHKLQQGEYPMISYRKSAGSMQTVQDLNRLLVGDMKLVFDDPLSDMDPSVAQDVLLAKITASMKENRYDQAIPSFERLERLGVALPESFYYFYILALNKGGRQSDAKTRAANYLTDIGRKGAYYKEVVEIMAQ
ncbi:hypothetical protein [Variovorax sp. 770b2]|uniref:hypothetical protein n=1 Tax=Variovorax sp. 770b2 TaxID=1566271 RepID=UPI0008F19DD1|nr:hypothetical protein [Variovorax sp. 770b2]SFQ34392.1 hypothetical protein SAMN03159339_6868 [Variovorax sp. 770b2]